MSKVVVSMEYGTKLTYTPTTGGDVNIEFWGDDHAQKAITHYNEQRAFTHHFTPLQREVKCPV